MESWLVAYNHLVCSQPPAHLRDGWLTHPTHLPSIETDLVIIAACAPALPKLVLKVLGKDMEDSAERVTHPFKPRSHGYRAFDPQSSSIGMEAMHGNQV